MYHSCSKIAIAVEICRKFALETFLWFYIFLFFLHPIAFNGGITYENGQKDLNKTTNLNGGNKNAGYKDP